MIKNETALFTSVNHPHSEPLVLSAIAAKYSVGNGVGIWSDLSHFWVMRCATTQLVKYHSFLFYIGRMHCTKFIRDEDYNAFILNNYFKPQKKRKNWVSISWQRKFELARASSLHDGRVQLSSRVCEECPWFTFFVKTKTDRDARAFIQG